MKYLGMDYGDKHIGIAISDEDGKFAFPRVVLDNNLDKVLFFLKEFIETEKVGEIILGLPLNFSMGETKQTKKVREFAEILKNNLDIEVAFQNEILSTKEVQKGGGASSKMIDASSAALILQSFLDNRR